VSHSNDRFGNDKYSGFIEAQSYELGFVVISEKETECGFPNSTVIREEAKELKEKIEKVQERIHEQEQNICQQKHQLQNLLPPTSGEQAMAKGNRSR